MSSPNDLPELSRHRAGSFSTEWALDHWYEGYGSGPAEALPGEHRTSAATDERSQDDWGYHPTVSAQFG
jgi:hypothetical protein